MSRVAWIWLAAVWALAGSVPLAAQDPADLHVLPVQGNVYMLVGAGANITMSIGDDGILLVDSGLEEYADYIAATALGIGTQLTASPQPNNCLGLGCPDAPFGWSSPSINSRLTSPKRAKPIRYIINTSADPDKVGGNEKLAELPENSSIIGVTFPPVGLAPTANLLAHENVLGRMSEPVSDDPDEEDTLVDFMKWPTLTYRELKYKLSEFFNGEGVVLYHVPNAHTDGDTMVYFRYSDVIAAGDILDNTQYPRFEVEQGGSINGILEGLNLLLDLGVAEFRSQGGTMIVPGHGRLMDIGDLTNYRNMVEIIRDRVQALIDQGKSLDEVLEARPSMDYDGIYGEGRDGWNTERFLTAVYESLTNPVE